MSWTISFFSIVYLGYCRLSTSHLLNIIRVAQEIADYRLSPICCAYMRTDKVV